MAATVDVEVGYRTRKDYFAKRQNASTRLFTGALAAVLGPGHGVALEVGTAKIWTGANNEIPVGLPKRPVGIVLAASLGVGDSGFTAAENLEADLEEGIIITNSLVAGVTGKSDENKRFYYSDDNTLTLTDPGHGVPQGLVLAFTSAGRADVMLFSVLEHYLLTLSGGNKVVQFGRLEIADFAAGALIGLVVEAPCHGRIVDFYVIAEAAAGGAVNATVQPRIGGVATTGGLATLNTANLGAANAITHGTSFTALNRVHKGDVIDLLATEAGAVDMDTRYVLIIQPDVGL